MSEPAGLAEALGIDLAGSFPRLIDLYQDSIYRFGLHLAGRPEDAEEIAQDTFARAYRAMERYPPERIHALVLRPWLHAIALNVFRNRLRGQPIKTVSLDRDGSEQGALRSAASDEPEDWVARVETREALRAVLTTLPERYRIPVVLRHVEGMGYREVATILGQPVGTVKSNVHRGTRLLRSAFDRAPTLTESVGRGGG